MMESFAFQGVAKCHIQSNLVQLELIHLKTNNTVDQMQKSLYCSELLARCFQTVGFTNSQSSDFCTNRVKIRVKKV